MTNKTSLRQAIVNAIKQDLATATKAADSARETATSKETVAENKYDTFGLEASYLAHGQSKRAAELLQAIDCYESLPFKQFTENEEIALSALVTLEADEGNRKHFFIGPDAGGLQIQWEGNHIMIITPQTPLGHQLLNKSLGDSIELTIKNHTMQYEIIAIG